MALGTPRTNKFHIGNAELRIGPLSMANKLTQAHSVGLLQSATVNFNQESVDLEGGLPKQLIDTVITRTNVTISAQAYEYSRKNIRMMINEGAESVAPSEYSGEVAVSYTAGTTATEVIQTTLLLDDVTVGDMLVIYNVGAPEKVSVVKVASKAARTAPNATMAEITIDGTKTPVLFDAPQGTLIYKANQIGLGNTSSTNYFAAEIISLEHTTGRPKGFSFWKCAVSGGMEYAFNNDNYAVTPITLKVLTPAASEYGAGEDLVHLADIIPTHPYGMFWAG
jgi:hypothetical protein